MSPLAPYKNYDEDDAGDEYAAGPRALIPRDQGQRSRRAVDWSINGSILAILILTAVYALSPVDAVPDFLPVAGQADDLAALVAGGGSVAFLSVLRYILRFVLRSRLGRWGCLLVASLTAIGACAVFGALLRLLNTIF